MRFYKLTISDNVDSNLKKNSFNGFVWELNANNPIAPRIEFAIQSYQNTQNVCFIKLYNPPLSFVKNAKLLQGKFITLEAGLKQSTFTNKNKIPAPIDFTIFKGKIETMQTAIEGTEIISAFYVSPDMPKTYKKSFNVNPNEKPAEVFKRQFEAYYKHWGYSTIKVEIDKNALSVINDSEQSAQFKPNERESSNYIAYLQKSLNSFGLGTFYNHRTQTLYIIKDDMSDDADLIAYSQVIECQASEFVEQPKWETIAQVSFLMQLNAKYRVGSILRVPSNVVFSGAGVLTSNVNVGLAGDNLAICEAGDYAIIGVEHLGNSREVATSNWATKIIAQRLYK